MVWYLHILFGFPILQCRMSYALSARFHRACNAHMQICLTTHYINIVNIDISSVVIENMKKTYPQMTCNFTFAI